MRSSENRFQTTFFYFLNSSLTMSSQALSAGVGRWCFFQAIGQLPADFGFGQRDGGESVGVDFAGVVFGQKGDAHMVRHHVGEQVPLSGAADDVGREALAAAGGLDGFVEGKAVSRRG